MVDKLVSVITPTWQRPKLLAGAIENVRAQTYRPLEHVIVSDGPDEPLCDLIIQQAYWSAGQYADDDPLRVPIRFVELGRNWSSFLPDSFCAAPVVAGMLLARGAYQAWLSDDERMDPDHIASLVDALEAEGADFAYSRATLWRAGGSPASSWEIGADPPREGQITNCLYRAELLKRGLYPFGAGMTSDWALFKRWMDAGATWAFVDRVTLQHRVDH